MGSTGGRIVVSYIGSENHAALRTAILPSSDYESIPMHINIESTPSEPIPAGFVATGHRRYMTTSWLSALAVTAWLLSSAAATGCKQTTPERPPTISDFTAGSDAKQLGAWLMSLSPGLYRLDSPSSSSSQMVLAVHGYQSKGYEWIHLLTEFAGTGARIGFFRWDDTHCPEDATKSLAAVLTELAADSTLSNVQIFAHSMGGVVTGMTAEGYQGRLDLEIHFIASPLAGISVSQCAARGVTAPSSERVTLFQWRTQKDLDGVYKSMDRDPQVVDLPGEMTVLPEEYNGNRLGHNWSVSWVADEMLRRSATSKPESSP